MSAPSGKELENLSVFLAPTATDNPVEFQIPGYDAPC